MRKLLPSRRTTLVAVFITLVAAPLLWYEVDPKPRHQVEMGSPAYGGWKNDNSRPLGHSPDGKIIVCRAMSQSGRAYATHLFDPGTERIIPLGHDIPGSVMFDPAGKRVAGAALDFNRLDWKLPINPYFVFISDRETGRELARIPRGRTEMQVAFHPDAGILLMRGWLNEGKGKDAELKPDIIALDTNKPWDGDIKEFDKLHDEQAEIPMGGTTTPDGRTSAAIVKGECVMTDNNTFKSRPIPSLTVPDDEHLMGITADGSTVLIHSKRWPPLRSAWHWCVWVYSATAADPAPAEGIWCVDAATGRTVAFLPAPPKSWGGEVGLTPDGKTLIAWQGEQLVLYDWPPSKPWGVILGGAALVFVSVVLLGKLYAGYRWLRQRLAPSDGPYGP